MSTLLSYLSPPTPPPCYFLPNRPAAADSPNTAVNRLPPAAANSVTKSFSTPQTNSSPKNTAAALFNSPKADSECSVGPLVDLSDAPKVAPASSPPVLEPVSPPSANGDSPQNPCESVKAPSSTQSKDLQVDGQSNDARCAPCSDSTTSTQNEYEHLRFLYCSLLFWSFHEGCHVLGELHP